MHKTTYEIIQIYNENCQFLKNAHCTIFFMLLLLQISTELKGWWTKSGSVEYRKQSVRSSRRSTENIAITQTVGEKPSTSMSRRPQALRFIERLFGVFSVKIFI